MQSPDPGQRIRKEYADKSYDKVILADNVSAGTPDKRCP